MRTSTLLLLVAVTLSALAGGNMAAFALSTSEAVRWVAAGAACWSFGLAVVCWRRVALLRTSVRAVLRVVQGGKRGVG